MYPVNSGNTLKKSVSVCVLFFLAWFYPHLDLFDRYLSRRYAPFYFIFNLIYDPVLMNGTRLELLVSHLSEISHVGDALQRTDELLLVMLL